MRTGVLVLAGLVPFAAAVFFLDELQRAFVEGPSLVVVADEIEGLETGADVWVAGRPAGRVAGISYVGAESRTSGSIAMRLVLHRDAAPALRRDAEARIGESALLAPPVVKLDPGSPSAPPFEFGDTLVVVTSPDVEDFRALADTAGRAADRLREDLGRLAEVLETGDGTLPRLRRDPGLAGRLDERRTRASRLRAAWAEGEGLRALVGDSATRSAAGRVRERLRELADAAPDSARQALAAEAADLAATAERLSVRLEAAEGTLGRLAGDDALREQVERARAQLDSLRVDAATDPLRYLRFRLF